MADGVAITAGSGTIIATDDVSSQHYQRIKRSVGPDGSVTDFLDKAGRQDTYTGTGTGTAVDVSAQAMKRIGVQVKGTGAAPASWTVVVEGSLDGTNFVTAFITHATADGDGALKSMAEDAIFYYFRPRVTALDLGSATNIVVTIAAKP